MRSSLTRGLVAKALLTVAAAALLAGCSNSIERFQSAYNNPSDADPVYTASVPKARKIAKPAYKAPAYEEPSYEQAANDTIEESPVKRAAIPTAKKPLDYASAYKPAYKQPKLTSRPKLIPAPEEVVADASDEQYVAPVVERAPFKKAASKKPRLIVPEDEQTAEVEAPKPFKKKIKFNQSAPVVEDDVAVAEPVVKSSKAGGVHTVGNGDTLYSLGRKYGVSPFVIADANGFSNDQQLTLGQRVKIPGGKVAKVVVQDDEVADAEPVVKGAPFKKKAPLSLTEDEQVASDDGEAAIGEAPKKIAAEPKLKIKEPAVVAEAPSGEPAMGLRWPLKGKIISGFGNKPNGLKNEGINIAVPEGTSVRAAESGVVAYSGNELKGYGNLVLIRHAGGYVTAYAHAKELFVKRGDTVKRGDVIAKAGQTGSVSSPQLHFEVRKGATALDPMKFISSTTAAN
jgi:murein DD-endopeptidase MepM/ murein hydrolase activator NlpD